MKWARTIAAFVAALVVGPLWIIAYESSAAVGDDSPEHLEATYRNLSLFCLVRALCRASSDALDAMKGALAGRSDAEYGLAPMSLSGDWRPSHRAGRDDNRAESQRPSRSMQ